MNTCYFCKGDVEQTTVNHMVSHGDRHVLIKGLQVEKCRQCGELFFDLDASRAVERAIKGDSATVDVIQVPVVLAHA